LSSSKDKEIAAYDFVHNFTDGAIDELAFIFQELLIQSKEEIRILDLGIGYGTVSIALAKRLCTLLKNKKIIWVGVDKKKKLKTLFTTKFSFKTNSNDRNEGWESFKIEKYPTLSIYLYEDFNVERFDLLKLNEHSPFNKNLGFDIVYAPWFFHHLIEWKKILTQVFHVLRENGKFIFMFSSGIIEVYDGNVSFYIEDTNNKTDHLPTKYWISFWKEIIKNIGYNWVEQTDLSATNYKILFQHIAEFDDLWEQLMLKNIEFNWNATVKDYENVIDNFCITPMKALKSMFDDIKEVNSILARAKEKARNVLEESTEPIGPWTEKRIWKIAVIGRKKYLKPNLDFEFYNIAYDAELTSIKKWLSDNKVENGAINSEIKKIFQSHSIHAIKDFNRPVILPACEIAKSKILNSVLTTRLINILIRENLLPKEDILYGIANVKLNGKFAIDLFALKNNNEIFQALSFIEYWINNENESFSKHAIQESNQNSFYVVFDEELKNCLGERAIFLPIAPQRLNNLDIQYESRFYLNEDEKENNLLPKSYYTLSEKRRDYKMQIGAYRQWEKEWKNEVEMGIKNNSGLFRIYLLSYAIFSKTKCVPLPVIWNYASNIVMAYQQEHVSKEIGTGAFLLATSKPLAPYLEDSLKVVLDVFYSKMSIWKWREITKDRMREKGLKAAVAAIMSRNMSHNIGSHILSSLGREGINAADDRILFQYLQHRMDYIAQISTEMPTWSSPVWFISDLMKRFYMQTHLLEYIGKSEGLGAKHWNNNGDKGKIVIKIRDKNDPDRKYIISDKPNELSSNLNDFQLAIPGGIVGLHAFYTILENILRNSAKHDWKKDSPGNPENLEITIEFENKPDDEFVNFTIYDNVSGQKESKDRKLHETINIIFSTDFIDDSGKLNKKNWGLGEMRISAGYLNQKTYHEIGFHKVESDSYIIKAITQEHNGKNRLAYQFNIPKPKELVVIGDSDLQDHGDLLKKYSIYIEEKINNKPYEHEIVVIFDNVLEGGDYSRLENLPGRIIIVHTNVEPNDLLKKMSDKLGVKEDVIRRKTVFLESSQYIELKGNLCCKEEIEGFKVELYKRWVEHLIPEKRQEFFYLNLEGTSDSKMSDYLEEQMYQLIKKHLVDSDFLEVECQVKDSVLNNLITRFKEMSLDELKKFISDQILNNFEIESIKITAIARKLESKKSILKELIFRDDAKIDTVPGVLNISNKDGDSANVWRNAFKELFPGNDRRLQLWDQENKKNPTMLYERHHNASDEQNQSPNRDIYEESLSGSQFYFTMMYDSLTSMRECTNYGMKKTILQLIENAQLKCVIIDERAARFLSSSNILQKKFEMLRIHVPFRIRFQNKDEVTMIENTDSNIQPFSNNDLDTYDIFIIHQGVLDKMGLTDKIKIEEFLKEIKQSVPFVFVTSGRGKPENVTHNVKFLPFSSVDSFLLKEYPEKILLIQSIMRLNLSKNGEPV